MAIMKPDHSFLCDQVSQAVPVMNNSNITGLVL